MSADYTFYVWTAYGVSGLGLAVAVGLTVYGWLRAPRRRRRTGEIAVKWIYVLPALGFVFLAGFLFYAMHLEEKNPDSALPSALIGKAAPRLELAPLDTGTKGFGPREARLRPCQRRQRLRVVVRPVP